MNPYRVQRISLITGPVDPTGFRFVSVSSLTHVPAHGAAAESGGCSGSICFILQTVDTGLWSGGVGSHLVQIDDKRKLNHPEMCLRVSCKNCQRRSGEENTRRYDDNMPGMLLYQR